MSAEVQTKVALMVRDEARSARIGRAGGPDLVRRPKCQEGVGTDAR